MPATNLAAQQVNGSDGLVSIGAGTVEVACDAVNGNAVPNSNGRTLLLFRNSTAGALNVTITTPNTEDGNAVSDKVVSVPANGQRIVGPLRVDVYGNPVVFQAAAATVFVTVLQFP